MNAFSIFQRILTIVAVCVLMVFSSCTTVRPYQKQYVNDALMHPSADGLEFFELSFQSYREGAAGASGGNSGGGCGCN